MRFHRVRTTKAFGLGAVVLISLALAACDDAVCPSGTTEQLGHCIRNSELADAEVSTAGEQAITGSAGTSAVSPVSAGAGIGPTSGGSGGASGSDGERGGASGEGAAAGTSGSSGDPQDGSSGATAGTGGMGNRNDKKAGTSGNSSDSNAGPRCGNGVPEADEICDGDDCPKSCPAATGCATWKLAGSASQCDAECVMMEITATIAGDGCCPDGANASTDSDCPAHCGDGVLDSNEKCEVGDAQMPCPTSCDDKDPCTKDMLVGSAAQCTAACMNTMITRAMSGDMCCPSGANAETDSDCPTKCGDGVVTGNETCDPKSQTERCPTSCDDGNACTMDKVNGSAAQCTAECSNPPITTARDGDGCCPAGTLRRDDSDCTAECASPSDCGTTQECKKWQCTAGRCVSTPTANASCSGGTCAADGTCKPNARCGDGTVNRPEEECEVGVNGATEFTCGPTDAPADKRCKNRTVYTPCNVSGVSCNRDSSCQLGTDPSMAGSLCLPISGLGFDMTGDPAQVCPLLDGYTQKLYSNEYCVIDCDLGRCPDHLPVCTVNPLSGSSPREAKRYCAPAPN